MAITFELNASTDLTVKNGTLKLVNGADEVKQRIQVALNHYAEEYFLNVPGGVPWFQYILGSKDKKNVELIIRRAIFDVPGVISVVNVRSVIAGRSVDIYADVEVSGGEVVTVQVGG